jgi:hypothetical protein
VTGPREAESAAALKEWASLAEAVGDGRLAVLVRKGGIHEKRFGTEVRAFWLFPTLYHQDPAEVTEPFRAAVPAAPPRAPVDEIPLRVFCEAADVYRVESLEAAERLAGLHPLAPQTVRDRFAYRGKPYLHVLVVRAFRLPAPRVVPNTLDYEGCVSWVRLDDPVSTEGALPALDDAAFDALRAEVAARLGTDGVTRI